jgi:hypothetical protein
MKWIIVDDSREQTIYGRVDDDGLMRVTCVAEHPEFAEWLAAGNEPEIIET